MLTTRRRLLAAGLGGAALLGVGGALRWVSAGYALPAADVALGLSVKELVVVRAIVDALVPGGDGLPSGLDLGVHQRIDEEVWAQTAALRDDLRAALQLLEHAPPLLGAFDRLSSLPRDARARVFERMLRSGPDVVVQAAVAMKQLTHLHYFASPAVWPHIGYDGPWVPDAKPASSHEAYERLAAEARARRRREA